MSNESVDVEQAHEALRRQGWDDPRKQFLAAVRDRPLTPDDR